MFFTPVTPDYGTMDTEERKFADQGNMLRGIGLVNRNIDGNNSNQNTNHENNNDQNDIHSPTLTNSRN